MKKLITESHTVFHANSWEYLEWFQVLTEEIPQDNYRTRVFRNGRQQVPITILLTARNAAGEYHQLTEEELATLELVDYYDGRRIDHAWSKDVFDYYRDYENLLENKTNDSYLPAEKAGRQSISLWITTTSTEVFRVAARIQAPGGNVFVTNTSAAAPGGAPTDGKFNSSLTIVPMGPLTHSFAAFSMAVEELEHQGSYQIDYYRIRFVDTRLKIRRSTERPFNDRVYYYYNFAYGTHIYHILFPAGFPTSLTFEPPTHQLSITLNVNTPDGTAAVLRVGVITPANTIGDRLTNPQVTFMDSWGNESNPMWLKATDDGAGIKLVETEPT